ncbi:adenosylcobinamide-GDP ribazoletransferase [Arenibacterium sp. CAU 1754]
MRKTDTNATATRPAPHLDFVVACLLLTRLPLPRLPDQAFAHQARAVWAFPLVGLLVGALAASAGWAALAIGMPAGVAAGVILSVQIILTGAMHEDGLGDTADGLWGGHTPERRLEIMKDSAIGTYGVLALLLSLGLRWIALTALVPLGLGTVVAVAALSRAGMPTVMAALPHARSSGLSHHVGAPSGAIAGIAIALGGAIALALCGPAILAPTVAAGSAVLALALIARAKIGGQTGDILGTAQQLCEVALLLGLVAQL